MAVAMQRSLSASALSTMVSHNSVMIGRPSRGTSSQSQRSGLRRTSLSHSSASSSVSVSKTGVSTTTTTATVTGESTAVISKSTTEKSAVDRPHSTDDVSDTTTLSKSPATSTTVPSPSAPATTTTIPTTTSTLPSKVDTTTITTTDESKKEGDISEEKRVMRVQSEPNINSIGPEDGIPAETLLRFKQELKRRSIELGTICIRDASDASDSSLSSNSSSSSDESIGIFGHTRQRTGSGQASCSELADMTTPSLSSLATSGCGTARMDPLRTAILSDATLQGGFEEKTGGSSSDGKTLATFHPESMEIAEECELIASVPLAVANRSKRVAAATASTSPSTGSDSTVLIGAVTAAAAATLSVPSPSKKKKRPSATLVDYQSVLDSFQYAKTRDFEDVLRMNEGHVLEFRDKVYRQAKEEQGITVDSPDNERLSVVGKIVEFLFQNVEPPDVYTKKTDIGHFKEVASLAIQGAKKKCVEDGGDVSKFNVPITLVLSAWLHDVERFIPSVKCKYLHESVDKYRKQLVHPVTSARVAMVIFDGAPLTDAEKQRVFAIIEQHDKPVDQVIYILDTLLLDKPKPDILDELQTLMDADSMAFFKHTVGYFVETKAKKYSPSWMWTRIITNVKRLRPPLRRTAVECMEKLSDEIKEKMGWVRAEVIALCPPDLTDTTTSPL